MGGNPETATDPTGNVRQGPNGATSWTNPNGDIIMSTPQAGASVIGHTHPWDPGASAGTSIWGNILTIPGLSSPGASSSSPSVQKKPDIIRQPIAECGSGLGAVCPHVIANYAVYVGPFSFGVPGSFNPGNVFPDGGGDDSGTGGGGSGKTDDSSSGASDCGGGLSFIATTRVATKQGEQAIGTLKVGEQVWAYNPTTKKMELQPILHVWINHDNDLVDLTIIKTAQGKATKPISDVLHTNKKHPFLTVEKGFLPVGQIKLGMHVVEADGQTGVVSGWKVVPGVKVMYNLEVAQDHTYTVGVGQWVVHNSSCPAGLDPSDPVVVIGETMDRVEKQAQDLENDGFEVHTYGPKGWRGGTIADMNANRAWIRYWAKEKDAQIVDIGLDPDRLLSGRTRSRFYAMEIRVARSWGARIFNHDPGF